MFLNGLLMLDFGGGSLGPPNKRAAPVITTTITSGTRMNRVRFFMR
jgi:hypothetical protein